MTERRYEQDVRTRRVEVRSEYVRQDERWGGHWRDDRRDDFRFDFHFRSYLYDPFSTGCYISPWYEYSALPAYLPARFVTVEPGYRCAWNEGTVYFDGGYDSGLNAAVSDIQTAFAQRNAEAMAPLLPPSQQVAVFNGGAYQYSIAGENFYQTLEDTVVNANSVSFQVNHIDRFGGGAVVHATDTLLNPDGSETAVAQTYRLRLEGGDRYVVTDFMTSQV